MNKPNIIEIWSPRYKTNSVLVATYKVAKDNVIVFTKAKYLMGKEFYVSGSDIRSCPLDNNGKIACYDVPMSMLKLYEREETYEEKAL